MGLHIPLLLPPPLFSIFAIHFSCLILSPSHQGPNTGTLKSFVRYAQLTKFNALETSSFMKNISSMVQHSEDALDIKEFTMDAPFLYEDRLARRDQFEENKIPLGDHNLTE
jgi:hypothetical protein